MPEGPLSLLEVENSLVTLITLEEKLGVKERNKIKERLSGTTTGFFFESKVAEDLDVVEDTVTDGTAVLADTDSMRVNIDGLNLDSEKLEEELDGMGYNVLNREVVIGDIESFREFFRKIKLNARRD